MQDSRLSKTDDLSWFRLDKQQETDVLKLSGLQFSPREIAAALELQPAHRDAFCILAETPGSFVAELIATGLALGKAEPQLKLQEAAKAGNIEAVRTLAKIQSAGRYQELLAHLDDDEFTL